MNLQRLAGILMIVGFALVIIGSIVGPQIYQEPDNAVRLNLIADDQTGWFISNLSFALGAVATAIGFLLISIHLRGSVPLWLPYLAATVFILGSVFLGDFFVCEDNRSSCIHRVRLNDDHPYLRVLLVD